LQKGVLQKIERFALFCKKCVYPIDKTGFFYGSSAKNFYCNLKKQYDK